jgi:hypothetical protein
MVAIFTPLNMRVTLVTLVGGGGVNYLSSYQQRLKIINTKAHHCMPSQLTSNLFRTSLPNFLRWGLILFSQFPFQFYNLLPSKMFYTKIFHVLLTSP